MKKLFFVLLLMIALKPVMAQDSGDNIKSEEIDIIKPYQPILADAVKIPFVPNVVKNTTEKQSVSYDIPAKLLDVPYQAPSLKPAAMPKDESKQALPSLYAKVGFGNYFANLLDVIYSNTKNKNFNYGAEVFNYGNHSTDIKSRAMRQSGMQLFGTLYSKKFSMTGNLKYENDKRNAYGSEVLGMNADSVMRYRFNRLSAKITFQNTADLKLPFDWKSTVNPYFINRVFGNLQIDNTESGKENLHENGLNWMNQFSKTLKSGDKIWFNMNWQWNELSIMPPTNYFNQERISTTQIAAPNYKQPNSLFVLNPYYQINRKTWNTELGLNLSFDGSNTILLPHYESSKILIENYLVFYDGWKGWVQKNTYWDLQMQCPWLSYAELQNTTSQDSYMGVRGTDKKRISYNAKFTLLSYKHLPLFVNNDSIHGGEMTLKYQNEDCQMLNFHGDVAYNQNDKFKTSVAADYYDFYKPDQTQTSWAFHRPGLQIWWNANYRLADKLNLNASVKVWDKQKVLLGNQTQTLNGAVDVSLSALYNYNKYISAFVSLNNLLNQQYQVYYGYKALGLNAMLGVVFKY